MPSATVLSSAVSTAPSRYDVAVVGAGVVGCAVARRFTLEGARVVVLEKARDVLDGASKANSAILHTGFDEPGEFLERTCVQAGYREFLALHQRLGLPLDRCGALVVAWDAAQEARLGQLLARAHGNGVEDAHLIGATELRRREPRLGTGARAALSVPGESLIDPWSTPHAYLLQALLNGATLRRGAMVKAGHYDGDAWQLETGGEPIRARHAINCAGLYGDRLETALLGESSFRIRPRKGQFLVYDKPASRLLHSIVLPVPSATTKGVVVTRTVFGNLLVGPTAQEQDSRDDASVDRDTLLALRRQGEAILPDLADCSVTATYAGLRPASDARDYCIRQDRARHYLRLGAIRSTGLSAALGIAAHAWELYRGGGDAHAPPAEPGWPALPCLAESGERDWRRAGNGGVICHCELVTRREIEQALDGPLAAASLAGLKRRTRVTMGRCQGFYCSARLSTLTAQHFAEPLGVARG